MDNHGGNLGHYENETFKFKVYFVNRVCINNLILNIIRLGRSHTRASS